MSTEVEFSFARLTKSAKRHIHIFQVHQFLDRFAMGLTVAVVALALVDRDMDLFEISLLFGVYSLTTMILELPFGGLADGVGRKPVFLAAVFASLISMLLFLSSSNFYVLAVSFAFIGFGRALRSGTLDAWFVEKFRCLAPQVDVQPALAKAQWANAMGLACGAVLGGILPDVFGAAGLRLGYSLYDVSYAASVTVMIGVLFFTLLVIQEERPSLNQLAIWQGVARVPVVIKKAGLLALKSPPLFLLLTALGLSLMATNPVEVLWPTRAKPMFDTTLVNTLIGTVTALYFFSIAIGAFLSPVINRIFKRRTAVTLCVIFACLAILQIVLALQENAIGFITVFALYAVVLGAGETPASTILHACVENDQRSTVLSLRSLVQQLGAFGGLLLVGLVAEVYTTPLAWMGGAFFLIAAVLFTALLAKRVDREGLSGATKC